MWNGSSSRLLERAHWLPVPTETRDDATVFNFASGYDAYLLGGPTPQHVYRTVAPILDQPWKVPATVAEVRAALFYLARAANHSGSEITSYPATLPLIQRLGEMTAAPVLCLRRHDDNCYGVRPFVDESDRWLDESLHDLMLLALSDLPAHMHSGRLAWLGLTSKPELAVRDAVGWLLQDALWRYSVTREWKRSDLAILADGQPRVIVEGKAIYGFDALNPVTRAKYAERVALDIAKAHRMQPSDGVIATLVMVTPTTPWSVSHHQAVAYSGHSQNQVTAHGGLEASATAVDVMWEALAQLGQVGIIQFPPGIAFDSTVVTTMFVIQPSQNFLTSLPDPTIA